MSNQITTYFSSDLFWCRLKFQRCISRSRSFLSICVNLRSENRGICRSGHSRCKRNVRNHQERIRLRGLRDASNLFALQEAKFKKLFRLPIASAQYLCELLDDFPQLNESGYIPKHLKILAALHFYSDGSYQTPDGEDSLLSLSQPSVSRALEETTNAIVDILAPQYIKFPITLEEKQKTMREFQEMYNTPNVLGAIDGTHISIFKPPYNDPIAPGRLFFNRKGYYSSQVVTNATCRIISINPDFPGSTHDSAVWRASALALHMEREFLQHQGEQEQWLLGDKGYPLLPWLMTPVRAPETEAEQNCNTNHARARNVMEMTFGRLKNKLRCLHKHHTLHYEPAKAARIVIACCTLHNMFYNVFTDDDDSDSEDDSDDEDNDPAANDERNEAEGNVNGVDYLAMAHAKREELMNNYFR